MSTQQQSHVLLATDPSASVLVRVNTQGLSLIAYSPFGHAPPNQPAALSAFNGQVREHLLPIYLLGYGYRAFNTALQRFHTPDSLSPFDDGGLNAYAYCLADPINAVDPSGHRTIKGFKRVTNFFSKLFSSGSKTKKNSSVNLTNFAKKNSNTPSVTKKVSAPAANPNTTGKVSASAVEPKRVIIGGKVRTEPVRLREAKTNNNGYEGYSFFVQDNKIWFPHQAVNLRTASDRIHFGPSFTSSAYPPGVNPHSRGLAPSHFQAPNLAPGAPSATGRAMSLVRNTQTNLPW